MKRKILFGEILLKLMKERYRRNRGALAKAAHVSPSALSQYVRGRSTPSLEVLAHLAETLDVSLDFLVYGQESPAQSPELGYFAGHFEAHTRSVQERGAALHDLTARIATQAGSQFASLVRSVAEELVSENFTLAGALRPTDVVRLEACDTRTTIITSTLTDEILLGETDGEEVPLPSVFTQVVTENIASGAQYEYIVPRRGRIQDEARLLRKEIIRLTGLTDNAVDKQLWFRYVPHACIPCIVMHYLHVEKLPNKVPDLLDQVRDYIYQDPENDRMGFLAMVRPPSSLRQNLLLVPKVDVPFLLEEIEWLKGTA